MENKTPLNWRHLFIWSTFISSSYCCCVCLRCFSSHLVCCQTIFKWRRRLFFPEWTLPQTLLRAGTCFLWRTARRLLCGWMCSAYSNQCVHARASPALICIVALWHCSQCCGSVYSSTQEAAVEGESSETIRCSSLLKGNSFDLQILHNFHLLLCCFFTSMNPVVTLLLLRFGRRWRKNRLGRAHWSGGILRSPGSHACRGTDDIIGVPVKFWITLCRKRESDLTCELNLPLCLLCLYAHVKYLRNGMFANTS